ncbi:MAG TPA: inositol monophosphatase family protein, partial [Rugosimonospora sp.]|nr:inositol monophosphatase family protein [Rugosimonospora sp.]
MNPAAPPGSGTDLAVPAPAPAAGGSATPAAGGPPVGDAAFAAQVAVRAGKLLLDLRERVGFADPRRLMDTGDRESHELIMAELGRYRPGDAVLSEEGVRDAPDRQVAERVWIVDPLDGTREYGEAGRTDWAVHVALWSATAGTDSKLIAGAVALPA